VLKEADLISLSIPHMFRGHASCNNIGVAGKGPERGKRLENRRGEINPAALGLIDRPVQVD